MIKKQFSEIRWQQGGKTGNEYGKHYDKNGPSKTKQDRLKEFPWRGKSHERTITILSLGILLMIKSRSKARRIPEPIDKMGLEMNKLRKGMI